MQVEPEHTRSRPLLASSRGSRRLRRLSLEAGRGRRYSLSSWWRSIPRTSAAAHGGFDRSDAHFSRTALGLDEKGWKEMAALFHRTLEEVDRIHADSTERLDGDPHHDAIRASAMLLLLEARVADAGPARTQSRSGSGRARRVKH